MNEKIIRLTPGIKRALLLTIRKELELYVTKDNYICSGKCKSFLVRNGYVNSDVIIDRTYLQSLARQLA